MDKSLYALSYTANKLDISYDQYLKETKKLLTEYCESTLSSNSKIIEYAKLKNLSSKIAWLYANCKKLYLIFHSKLILDTLINNDGLSIIYELDAISSGSQIISIMMRRESFARYSNVVGKTPIDIYTTFISEFQDDIVRSRELLNTVLGDGPSIPELSVLATDKTKKLNTTKLTDIIIYALYNSELPFKELETILSTIKDTINNMESWTYVLVVPKNLGYYLNSDEQQIGSNFSYTNKGDRFCYVLLLCRALLRFEFALLKNPWIVELDLLKKRALSKKVLMTFAYGMGVDLRDKTFQEYLITSATERGIESIDKPAIEVVSQLLGKFFILFENKYLKTPKQFLAISRNYVINQLEHGIMINTPYNKWIYEPKVTK